MTVRKPRPPAHLGDDTRRWWASVTGDYQLEPHHLRLLQLACEAWERAQQAREILARDGITAVNDRGVTVAHPCVQIEKDARTGFARLVRELDLDTEAPRTERVGPPSLRSNSRGR